jgi:hypothetical protein
MPSRLYEDGVASDLPRWYDKASLGTPWFLRSRRIPLSGSPAVRTGTSIGGLQAGEACPSPCRMPASGLPWCRPDGGESSPTMLLVSVVLGATRSQHLLSAVCVATRTLYCSFITRSH